MTLTVNIEQAAVIIHTHAKAQARRSISLKDRLDTDRQTDRRTDVTDCFTLPANVATKTACKSALSRDICKRHTDE